MSLSQVDHVHFRRKNNTSCAVGTCIFQIPFNLFKTDQGEDGESRKNGAVCLRIEDLPAQKSRSEKVLINRGGVNRRKCYFSIACENGMVMLVMG
jgi:hypothetical protein